MRNTKRRPPGPRLTRTTGYAFKNAVGWLRFRPDRQVLSNDRDKKGPTQDASH